MADTGSSSSKRKARDAFVPDSIASYLMGALRDNFNHLKTHMQRNCAFVATNDANDGQCTKQLLEELFRYLYLLADTSSDGVVRSSPSYFVHQAFNCLMLNPVLYLKVCDEILNMQGKDSDLVKVRVLPHDALGIEDDEESRKTLYADTVARYKVIFGGDPPVALWGEYKPPSPIKDQTTAVAVSSAESTSLTPHQKEKGLKDTVTLRVTGSNNRSFDIEVTVGDRFANIIDRLAQHQQRDPKEMEFTYRRLILRGYMMPYSFNMKDGEVIACNIPLYSTEKVAVRAAAAAAATVSLSATVASQATTDTSATGRSTSTTDTPGLLSTPALSSAISSAAAKVAVIKPDTNMRETARAMGVAHDKCVSLLIFQDEGSLTNIVAQNGEVLLGEVMATYATHKGFALTDCIFTVRGLGLYPKILDPEALVNSLPAGMHIKCKYVPPPVACPVITIIMQYNGEENEVHVKVNVNTPMSKIMQTYAEHRGVEAKVLTFFIGQTLLRPEDTPESMHMKDNDKIVVKKDAVQ